MKRFTSTLMTATVVGLSLAFSPMAFAQDKDKDKGKEEKKEESRPERPGAGPGQRGEREGGQTRLDRMAQQLDLTKEQQAKLKPILEEQEKKIRELMGDRSLTQEQRREKMQKFGEEMTPKVKAILTAAQFEKYEKTRQQFRERGARPGGDGVGRPPRGEGEGQPGRPRRPGNN